MFVTIETVASFFCVCLFYYYYLELISLLIIIQGLEEELILQECFSEKRKSNVHLSTTNIQFGFCDKMLFFFSLDLIGFSCHQCCHLWISDTKHVLTDWLHLRKICKNLTLLTKTPDQVLLTSSCISAVFLRICPSSYTYICFQCSSSSLMHYWAEMES